MFPPVFVLFLFISRCSCDIRELIPLEAPENLTLVDIEDKDVILKWEPINEDSVRGTFRGYLVRVWNHGASQVYAIPPEVTKTSVQFFPFSKNFITVAVRNDKYVGPRSNTISFDAPQTEPSYPLLFEWHQLGEHSALLQWSKPIQPNGILMGYNIYCSEMNDFGIDEKTTVNYFIEGPDSVQTKITGLKKGKKYQINIGAVNCAGESDHNSLEFELDYHVAYAPSIPFFKYKINYNETDPQLEYKEKCLQINKQETATVDIDAFDDDYYILNESTAGKIIKAKEVAVNDVCLVKCLITWVPDIDNNPGEHFYVKYRVKGEREFIKTPIERNQDFVILNNFNACRNYEIILVALDGEYETESDLQESPAVMFMTKY